MAEISKASPTWRRSSYSGKEACVEALPGAEVRVRDSKRPTGPQLGISAEAWSAFTRHLGRI